MAQVDTNIAQIDVVLQTRLGGCPLLNQAQIVTDKACINVANQVELYTEKALRIQN